MRKQQREAILALLEETYMGTETALNYSTPFESVSYTHLTLPTTPYV